MSERLCTVGGGIEICHEQLGDPADPALLLIMGLGAQMVAWPAELCTRLAERGFHVIRFDNRDAGRSSHCAGGPQYTLEDMAGDAAGLLDELGVERAHVVGASMGAMIAQTLAAGEPERVLSLASLMSRTGGRGDGQPNPRVLPYLLTPPPADRDGYVDHMAEVFTAIGSPRYPPDADELRAVAGVSYDRGASPDGFGRQLAAILAAGPRTRTIRRITAPTLVAHGLADPLVAPSGGRATARAIPDAHLILIAGMGHDLPRAVWPLLIDAIVWNARLT